MVILSYVNDLINYNIEDTTATIVNIIEDDTRGKIIDFVIPEKVTLNETVYTVTAIAPNTFYGNNYIKTITIPASITLIGDEAFRQTSLNKVYFKGDKPTIGKNAFSDIINNNKPYGYNEPYGYVDNKLKSWEGVNQIDDLIIKNMSLYIKKITLLMISLIIVFILIHLLKKTDMHLGFKIPLYISIITYIPSIFVYFQYSYKYFIINGTILLLFLYLITKIPIIWLKIPLFTLLNIPNFFYIFYSLIIISYLIVYYIHLFS